MKRQRDLIIRGIEYKWWVKPCETGNFLIVENEEGKRQTVYVRKQSILPSMAKEQIIKYVIGEIYESQARRQKVFERTNRGSSKRFSRSYNSFSK